MSRLRPDGDPLRIGSVKTNVGMFDRDWQRLFPGSSSFADKCMYAGHMEAASGIASLVKCILMLEREVILPSINHVVPNPKIPLREWNLKAGLKFQYIMQSTDYVLVLHKPRAVGNGTKTSINQQLWLWWLQRPHYIGPGIRILTSTRNHTRTIFPT